MYNFVEKKKHNHPKVYKTLEACLWNITNNNQPNMYEKNVWKYVVQIKVIDNRNNEIEINNTLMKNNDRTHITRWCDLKHDIWISTVKST